MKRSILILLLLFTLAGEFMGQNHSSLKGYVSADGIPEISYAKVHLYLIEDSSIVARTLTDEQGEFWFKALAADNYQLKISFPGFLPFVSGVVSLGADEHLDSLNIELVKEAEFLDKIDITARRKTIILKADRTIFNISGTIHDNGLNSLELLKKAPGVVVNSREEISLAGLPNVQVQVNGKQVPLSGSDLAAFLKTIPSSEVEKIELINNPSASYDASGSGGIINIILKKNKLHGSKTILNLGYSKARAPWYNGGVNSYIRNKKLSLFGSYNINSGTNLSEGSSLRIQDAFSISQENEIQSNWDTHSFRTGLDIFLNEKSSLGFQFRKFNTRYEREENSDAPIFGSSLERIDSILISTFRNQGRRSNLTANLNFRSRFSRDHSFSIDADFGSLLNPNFSQQPNTYLNANRSRSLSEFNFESEKETAIDLWVLRSDMELNFGKSKIQTGVKETYSKTTNSFDFFNVNPFRVLDFQRSQDFEYRELISALYADFQHSSEKVNVQAGVRAEYTQLEGVLQAIQNSGPDTFKRSYLDLFPSAGISVNLNDKNSFQLNYSRRINRPSYTHLNPFLNQLDELSFEEGNPSLLPEYSNRFQLTHGLNYQIFTSISYSHTRNKIVRVRESKGISSTIFRYKNLAEQFNLSISTSMNFQLASWWNMYNNFMFYHLRNRADFGTGKIVNDQVSSFYVYSQQSISLPANFNFELYGWYNSPALSGANMRASSVWSLDAGISKKLLNERAKLNLTISDIFFTNRWQSQGVFDNIEIYSQGSWDSRRINLYFSLALGKTSVGELKLKDGLKAEGNRIDLEQEGKKW
ncbi:MAG: TonB-dependent receptor [Bacteroidia bacterium]|nr:TonB-dependent receptor [Bacteroidia bacterium]